MRDKEKRKENARQRNRTSVSLLKEIKRDSESELESKSERE